MSDHIDRERLSAYVDGELEDNEKASVESHAASCSSCRRELEIFQRLHAVLASSPRKPMPAALMAEIEERFASRSTLWSRVRQWVAAPVVWIPAGSLAVAALSVFLWLGNITPEENSVPMDALLAAHSRYSAESSVPGGNLVNSEFFTHLIAYHADK